MNKTFITAIALMGAFAATASAADYKGSLPVSGKTYRLYNVGAKQFLGTDGAKLVLGGERVEVSLDGVSDTKTPGFFRLTVGSVPLTAGLYGLPQLSEDGKFAEWRMEPVAGTDGAYAISSRNTEASASFYLYQNSLYNRLAAMPQQPAKEFEAAQWLLVDAAEVETPNYKYSEDDATYERHDDAYASVDLYREFTLNQWNIFCSPVDIDEEQLKDQLGDDVHVAELTGYDGSELKFTTTHSVKAGVPCIVNPTKATLNGNYEFIGNMQFASRAGSVEQSGLVFYGTLALTTPSQNAYGFNTKTSAVQPLPDDIVQRGVPSMSGYFVTTNATSEITSWSLDGTTGIGSILSDGIKPADVYTIGGQKVKSGATSIDNLERGVYVLKGKKAIKK